VISPADGDGYTCICCTSDQVVLVGVVGVTVVIVATAVDVVVVVAVVTR